MMKEKFKEIFKDGYARGKLYMIVKIETEGNPAPEIIINLADSFNSKIRYYDEAYDNNMELINAKKSGKIIKIVDVLMTSNLNDLSWFIY